MARPVAKCGTDAGYYRHLRRTKTDPCEACKRAHADRWLERRKDPFGQCPCGTPLRTRNTYCSRCRRKHERAAARRDAQLTREEEMDKSSPDGWVRRGLIWYPVYEQSEVGLVPWFRDLYADAVRDCGYALRPNEKLVALVYAEHAGDPSKPQNDLAWVSWGRLSEQTGIRSKDALNRAVRHLERRGWLVLVEPRRQHKSPRYRIVIPDQPDVRETYVCEEPEVRETDLSEVRETDNTTPSDVRETDISPSPEVRETTPEVRETTARGTPHGPDPSTDPSTTDNPPSLERNHRPREQPTCTHPNWTYDHHCIVCDRYEPCPDCRRLARINDTIRCHQHQDHQESA